MSKLKVPEGVTSATLEDTQYDVDEDGTITVDNHDHILVLTGHPHNFELVDGGEGSHVASEEPVIDEMLGAKFVPETITVKDESLTLEQAMVLLKALQLASVTVHDWNTHFSDDQRKIYVDQAVTVLARDANDALSAHDEEAAAKEKPAFDEMTRGAIVDWLREHGCEEGDPKDRRPSLVELAEKTWEGLQSEAEAPAEEQPEEHEEETE